MEHPANLVFSTELNTSEKAEESLKKFLEISDIHSLLPITDLSALQEITATLDYFLNKKVHIIEKEIKPFIEEEKKETDSLSSSQILNALKNKKNENLNSFLDIIFNQENTSKTLSEPLLINFDSLKHLAFGLPDFYSPYKTIEILSDFLTKKNIDDNTLFQIIFFVSRLILADTHCEFIVQPDFENNLKLFIEALNKKNSEKLIQAGHLLRLLFQVKKETPFNLSLKLLSNAQPKKTDSEPSMQKKFSYSTLFNGIANKTLNVDSHVTKVAQHINDWFVWKILKIEPRDIRVKNPDWLTNTYQSKKNNFPFICDVFSHYVADRISYYAPDKGKMLQIINFWLKVVTVLNQEYKMYDAIFSIINGIGLPALTRLSSFKPKSDEPLDNVYIEWSAFSSQIQNHKKYRHLTNENFMLIPSISIKTHIAEVKNHDYMTCVIETGKINSGLYEFQRNIKISDTMMDTDLYEYLAMWENNFERLKKSLLKRSFQLTPPTIIMPKETALVTSLTTEDILTDLQYYDNGYAVLRVKVNDQRTLSGWEAGIFLLNYIDNNRIPFVIGQLALEKPIAYNLTLKSMDTLPDVVFANVALDETNIIKTLKSLKILTDKWNEEDPCLVFCKNQFYIWGCLKTEWQFTHLRDFSLPETWTGKKSVIVSSDEDKKIFEILKKGHIPQRKKTEITAENTPSESVQVSELRKIFNLIRKACSQNPDNQKDSTNENKFNRRAEEILSLQQATSSEKKRTALFSTKKKRLNSQESNSAHTSYDSSHSSHSSLAPNTNE